MGNEGIDHVPQGKGMNELTVGPVNGQATPAKMPQIQKINSNPASTRRRATARPSRNQLDDTSDVRRSLHSIGFGRVHEISEDLIHVSGYS